MIKTFKKLWSIVDLTVDLMVDAMKAVHKEIKSELDESTPPKSE